jgi:hypothetical protein
MSKDARLTNFLIQLYDDRDMRTRFENGPEETMDAARLSPYEKEVILSRDEQRITEAILAEQSDSVSSARFASREPWILKCIITIVVD